MRTAVALAVILSTWGCGDDGGGDPPSPAKWQKLAEGQPSSLLAAWAPSPSNVYIVGGREGIGGAPVAWHFDGSAWTKLDHGLTNVDFWQVFGFDGGPVFIGGSNGTIMRYENGTFTKMTTPSADIIFGLWGTSPTDMWAVGGQIGGNGFVWRYTGGPAWELVPSLPSELATATVWKVVGRAANDVFMSASQGLILHWDGTAISSEAISPTAETESLFSLGCNARACITAGTNFSNGVLYENTTGTWSSKVPTQDGPVWRGVTPTGEHRYVVGMAGAVLRDDNGTWSIDPHGLTTRALHAAWSDDEGNLFAVGGDFDRVPTVEGVILYKGTTELPPLP